MGESLERSERRQKLNERDRAWRRGGYSEKKSLSILCNYRPEHLSLSFSLRIWLVGFLSRNLLVLIKRVSGGNGS